MPPGSGAGLTERKLAGRPDQPGPPPESRPPPDPPVSPGSQKLADVVRRTVDQAALFDRGAFAPLIGG